MYVCVYIIYIYIYVCMFIYNMYIYIYINIQQPRTKNEKINKSICTIDTNKFISP